MNNESQIAARLLLMDLVNREGLTLLEAKHRLVTDITFAAKQLDDDPRLAERDQQIVQQVKAGVYHG